ncbi:hypothetical protein D3C80_1747850 [compost metagenome]
MGLTVGLEDVLAKPFDFLRLAGAQVIGRQAVAGAPLQHTLQRNRRAVGGREPEIEGIRRLGLITNFDQNTLE